MMGLTTQRAISRSRTTPSTTTWTSATATTKTPCRARQAFCRPGATVNHFQNVLIDSNLIVRQTDPRLPFPTYLQGIDAFDADWTNVTVTNNVVITSACHGITFASIHNSLIANNTVVEDGLVSTPGCVAAINVGGATHQGSPSSNTAVRNNLTSRLNVDTRNQRRRSRSQRRHVLRGPGDRVVR